MSELRKIISRVVKERQGIKMTELLVLLVPLAQQANIEVEPSELTDIIYGMIEQEELVSIQYILCKMTYREKIFLLPKGTEIKGKKIVK